MTEVIRRFCGLEARIDYLAERQNRPCRGGEMEREMIAKNNNGLSGFSGLEARIDYLAERQNRPCRGEEMEREMITKNNNRLSEFSGLEAKIDYLAEWENGEELKGRQMRRESVKGWA